MVDLRAKPFYLQDEDIAWVEQTIAGMSDEEKIGQLFMHMNRSTDPAAMQEALDRYHIGGIRYPNRPAAELYEQNRYLQEHAPIPLLIAANCEAGGNGGMSDGTLVATNAMSGAARTDEVAYQAGYVGGREAAAIGCNWNFAPVSDIFLNWRNTIVNTRSFSGQPDRVLERALAFLRGVRQSNVLACTKHFPGDGVEERDQHLLMGVNDLPVEAWDDTFGRVYRGLIDAGIHSMMVGHFAMPHYSRHLRPGLRDDQIMPATIAPELLQDLLRGTLGFNGLLVTDASHMVGLTSVKPRREHVPEAIAAGCDMFLYFTDEDFRFMMAGYRDGVITVERLHEALRRILGAKAALGLHLKAKTEILPPKEGLSVVGCREHREAAAAAARECITLVKNTRDQLPIRPETHRRVRLYYLSSGSSFVAARFAQKDHTVRDVIIEELTAAGFEVDLFDTEKPTMGQESREEYLNRYDVAMVFSNVSGYASENVYRIAWDMPGQVPWYAAELPTVFVSLNYTTHLYDVPMVRTFINAYAPTREVVRATIRKMMGDEPFTGVYEESVFCGRWDTRL
jgi:beta-N-acetylhexosaminidase